MKRIMQKWLASKKKRVEVKIVNKSVFIFDVILSVTRVKGMRK